MTVDATLARTALEAPTPPIGLAIGLEEAGLMGMISVKGDLASPEMAEAVRAAVGLVVPPTRRLEIAGDRRALWMAPDELLLQTPYAERAAAAAAADAALAGAARLVVDVSDARQVFRLTGAAARDVLAKGAPIDLHPSAFTLGDVRRTRIGTIAAAICQTAAEPDAFEVFCFRSYAPYLWRWLAASSHPGAIPDVLTS